tara:strand:+ start:77 stop:571 length:495 start_codon:yes stop_codon:yes gene_type:complete
MMGVGKSTIGKRLAAKLNLEFIDIDKIIEKKEKNTIREIFKNKGEKYFRKIEKKITLEELKRNNQVVALGGGAFINSAVRKEVKISCISFWLDSDMTFLLPRLKNIKKRPLLDHDELEKTINKIYSERKKIYNESNFKIKCNSVNKDKIVRKIIKLYESSRNKI